MCDLSKVIMIVSCPKCKSDNITTQKAKQPDGTMKDSIIQVNIVGVDLTTGVSTPTGSHIPYHSYVCLDCFTIFAVFHGKPDGVIT